MRSPRRETQSPTPQANSPLPLTRQPPYQPPGFDVCCERAFTDPHSGRSVDQAQPGYVEADLTRAATPPAPPPVDRFRRSEQTNQSARASPAHVQRDKRRTEIRAKAQLSRGGYDARFEMSVTMLSGGGTMFALTPKS